MNKTVFIIVYNSETDFIIAYTMSDVKNIISDILDQGYCQDEIQVYSATELEINIVVSQREITIN